MRRKRIHWTTVLIFAILFLIIGFFTNLVMAFYGNPISAVIATVKIKAYMKDTYPDMDLEINKARYNFKFEEYVSHVKSRSSQDTYFNVCWTKRKIYDSYENDVVKLYNTYDRLNREFSEKVEEIIQKDFPYETSILYAIFGKEEQDFEELYLDMPLDIKNPPMPANLVIYIMSDEVSYEFLSARLLELNQLMNKYEIPIDTYSVVIKEPLIKGEEKPAPNGKTLYLYDFPVGKISSANLIEVMKEHQRSREAEHQK